LKRYKIGIIGLGYVGLPLAVEFGKKFEVIGFDINDSRIELLKQGIDDTLEVDRQSLIVANESIVFTSKEKELQSCDIYIVTVPTPINKEKQPNLNPLISASELLGRVISKDNIVIYESTVYPGATEEECIPVIENVSGLIFNKDFFAGYSPERINPGDKERTVTNIVKITAGSTPEIADIVDALYCEIITAGTHKASSIKVAEAAKVIENTQRDSNIALINELAMIFNRMNIDTLEVLEAAGTKWNFLPFRPGLVGGHCISVDPYYLTHKAQLKGYIPDMILAGRRINDGMASYVVSRFIKLMLTKGMVVKDANVLILGLSFKENCPDLRNTKVVDIIHELDDYKVNVDVYDPWCSKEEALNEYGITLVEQLKENTYDAILLAVGHNEFLTLGADEILKYGKKLNVLYDLKSVLDINKVDERL
jgi:UDP-N-acetyl-D-galactosamine dehydrogenase